LEDQEYDEKENNPQKNRAYEQFGMFGRSDIRDFRKLTNKIKEANFITITIGGNDWLANFPIFEISSLQQNVLTKEEFDKIINRKNDDLLSNMKKMFEELRRLNPTANIVALNYSTTLSILLNFNKD
jgi:lysophospholipase L1-like esterase